MHHRVEVGDLAEAVAAAFERGGHEAESPLADVERGPPEVIGGRIPVGHHHLRERQPVRDRPQPSRVVEPHRVQDQAFAVVEAEPQFPVLPAQQVPVQAERDPVGLADLQRRHLAQRHRDQLGQVLAHHLGQAVRVGLVADLQQRHRVEIHDRMQPAEVVRVGVALLAAAVPDVRPAQPQATVTWRDQVGAKGPEVGEDARAIGDAAPGERRRQVRVVAQHLVALVPLVQRDIRLLAGERFPAGDGAGVQRHHGAVSMAIVAVPAHGQRLAGGRLAGLRVQGVPAQGVLGRLAEFDRGDPPPRAHLPVPPQHPGDLPEFLGGQRIERMARPWRLMRCGLIRCGLIRSAHVVPPRVCSAILPWPRPGDYPLGRLLIQAPRSPLTRRRQ